MRLKSLERWWRRLWIRILVRLMRRPSDGERPAWGAGRHRVLFLRHDRAGDMIVSTGVMRAIARSHPTIEMDVLASPANAAILAGATYVHDVIVFDRKRVARYGATFIRLRRARYDAVIDCMVTAPSVTTLLLILASGARFRIGIAGRGNDAAFNITVPPDERANAHMVDLLSALAEAFEVQGDAVERRPTLEVTDAERARALQAWGADDEARRVLVNISAGSSERVWPESSYASLIERVHARDAKAVVRVIAAPNEQERAHAIAEQSGALVIQTPSIRDAFALVATADLVVTPDTSITHAASAFRTPSVVLFVKGKAERWGLYDTPGTNVEHTEGTLATLPVDRVLAALDEQLDDPVQRGRVGDASLGKTR
jgi:ADP-heptose:LPS heptosyltransferase